MSNFIIGFLILVPTLLILICVIKLGNMFLDRLLNYIRRKHKAYNDWYDSLTTEEKILEELKRANQIRWFHFFK